MEFGFNPRGPDQKYSLIFFYEAFHHALDFFEVVKKISSYLLPGGKIILAGEPIVDKLIPAIPYLWGMRLDAETVVVTRSRKWLELGFNEDYICSIFADNKLKKIIVKDYYTDFGNLYIFERLANDGSYEIIELKFSEDLGDLIQSNTWHSAEENGRWTKENSTMNMSSMPANELIIFDMENPLPVVKDVSISVDGKINKITIRPNKSGKIIMETGGAVVNKIQINSNVNSPKEIDGNISEDCRSLGIFIKKITIEYKI